MQRGTGEGAAQDWASTLRILRKNKYGGGWPRIWALQHQGQTKTSLSLPKGMAIANTTYSVQPEQSQTEFGYKNKEHLQVEESALS